MKRIIIALAILIAFAFSLNSVIAKGGKSGKGASSRSPRSNRSSTRKSFTPKRQNPAKVIPAKETKAKPQKQNKTKPEKPASKENAKAKSPQDQTRGKAKGKNKEKAKDKEKTKNKAKGKSKDKAKVKGKDKQDKAKGKDKQQQLKTIEKQIAHETDKHKTRAAKFERLRELAAGDEKTLARIDKLAAREQQRFGTKTQRLKKRRSSPDQPDSDVKGKNKDNGDSEEVIVEDSKE